MTYTRTHDCECANLDDGYSLSHYDNGVSYIIRTDLSEEQKDYYAISMDRQNWALMHGPCHDLTRSRVVTSINSEDYFTVKDKVKAAHLWGENNLADASVVTRDIR